MKDFICEGCQADLSKGRQIPIHMTCGELYLACPVCKYEMRVSVDDKGRIFLC